MPEIVCPKWCVHTYEMHYEELGELEGFVIHHSEPTAGISHTRHAYPDNTVSSDEPLIHIEAQGQLTLAEAMTVARSLLAVIEEVQS